MGLHASFDLLHLEALNACVSDEMCNVRSAKSHQTGPNIQQRSRDSTTFIVDLPLTAVRKLEARAIA